MENILSLIRFDVGFWLGKFQEQIKNKQINHWFVKSNRDLLDVDALEEYLSREGSKNTFSLQETLNRSIQIIELNNKEIYDLIQGGGKTGIRYLKFSDERITAEITDKDGINLFSEEGNYETYLNQDIAKKCARIVNVITAACPELTYSIQNDEIKAENKIESKPALKPEAVQIVFDILKDFFSPEQQIELKRVIEWGDNANGKLLFKGNGNRLTDTFKKLIEHDFIAGCQKQDLIKWVISNFTYANRNTMKEFVYDTVEKTISRNYYPCKSPLIEVKKGQIQRVEQPRTKKYR